MDAFRDIFYIFVLVVFLSSVTGNRMCEKLIFHSINQSHLTVFENTTVNITFAVKTAKTCKIEEDFDLKVSKISDITHVQCAVLVKNGTCHSPGQISKCVCTSTPGVFQLIHTAHRSDTGTWEWTSKIRSIQPATLSLDVLYPPRVTNLTLTQNGLDVKIHPAEERSTVEVECKWEDGNPTSSVRLLDRRGKEITWKSYADGYLRHKLRDVRCDDAGSLQCVGPSATENKTATLLVKCKPDLTGFLSNITVVPGQDNEIRFPMRTHTTIVQECRMYQDPETENANITEINCTSFVAVTGTPPDLVLTVRLDNVTKHDEGQWRLELTNEAGSGLLNIGLKVFKAPVVVKVTSASVTGKGTLSTPLSNQRATSTDHFPVDVNMIVGAGIAVVVLLSVTFIIICGLKARQTVIVAQPQPVQELPMIERRAVRARQRVEREEEASGQSVHEYFYVPDSPPPSDEDEFADDEPPPPVCHGPGNPPTDYLNPEPSRDETEEEGAEFSTVPFYHNTQLRSVDATGTSFSTAADSMDTGASEMALDSNAETLDDIACAEYSKSDTTESEYVRYSPPLYENTMP